MARGKHATSAEARRARESAEIEAAASRVKIARLEIENAELREQLLSERAKSVATIRNYVAPLNEQSSPEVERLRRALSEAETRESEALLSAGLTVGSVMQARKDFAATPEFYAALAESLHVPLPDLLGARREDGRRARRTRLQGES